MFGPFKSEAPIQVWCPLLACHQTAGVLSRPLKDQARNECKSGIDTRNVVNGEALSSAGAHISDLIAL